MRTALIVLGWLCFVAGVFPSGWGVAHPLNDGRTGGTDLGIPGSPLFRFYRQTIESPRSTTIEDGREVVATWSSSTVHGWEIHVFSWSAALCLAGAVALVASLRRRAPREAT